MALSRIGLSADLANLFVRSSYAATSPRHGRQNVEKLHASTIRRYPEAPQLPLPSNVSEIFNIETSRFAPERARDFSTPLCMYNSHPEKFGIGFNASSSIGDSSVKMQQLDSHVDSYDCFGAVSLSSSMQTNVPKPFCSSGRSTYLNMPGGQWARDGKYIAETMKKSQFTVGQMRHMKRSGMLDGLLLKTTPLASDAVVRCYSTTTSNKPASKHQAPDRRMASARQQQQEAKKEEKGGVAADATNKPPPVGNLTKKERLQIIIRDYGKTVIVFHITISLISLGFFYTIVSSGLDITPFIKIFSSSAPAATEVANAAVTAEPLQSGEAVAATAAKDDDPLVNMIMNEGSTFLIAYAVHKLFAPIRISLTLGFTPMIVKYLRRKGILKMPKKPPVPT